MTRRPPRSTRTVTLLPDTTLFRSLADPVDLLRRGAALVFGHGARIEDRQADALLVQLVIDVVVEIGAEQLFREGLLLGHEEPVVALRSEEHTSELQSLMRISYAVFCLKKQTNNKS